MYCSHPQAYITWADPWTAVLYGLELIDYSVLLTHSGYYVRATMLFALRTCVFMEAHRGIGGVLVQGKRVPRVRI